MTSIEIGPLLNSKITSLKESSTLAINQLVKKKRASGESLVHFGFGESPFPVPESLKEALGAYANHKEYLPSQGLYELRESFCEHYNKKYRGHFHPDDVVVGPGSKELIFQILFLLEGPLIIPAPSWVSYGPQAHIRGKQTYVVQTDKKSAYKLTPHQLEEACRNLSQSHQKILILNSPNNPTGAVYDIEEIKALVPVCREHNVIVISDEIYALVNFFQKKYNSFSEFYPEGTIVTGGLSKGYSAGGYRLGLLAVPQNFKNVIKALNVMISETFSSVCAPVQYAAVRVYKNPELVEGYVNQCTAIHEMAALYLYQEFINMGLACVKPEGAFYLFPDFDEYRDLMTKKFIKTSVDLCHYLLNHHGVALLPGSDFYLPRGALACRVATVDYNGSEVYKASLSYGPLDSYFIETHCPQLKEGCKRLREFLSTL